MTETKLIGTKVMINDYQKVIDYIDLYNSKTGNDLSLSKFVWTAIKFYINHLRNHEGIK